ncbi:VapE domain-containing protein [Primorskyibacter sp. S87]|uniref:VapE domain-containing protein n=1 Tax=Primorskyibacter sp. S87 TaxID=3415126 RepID=UPI003C7D268F
MTEYSHGPKNQQAVTQSAWHRIAWDAGFRETIPVIPPGAALHDHSLIDPNACGKAPGEFYGGKWDGLGAWPNYQMDEAKVARWDTLNANVGLKMGHQWCALDVDITDDVLAQALLDRVHEISGGNWFIRWGAMPKFLVLFRVSGEPIRKRQYPIRKGDVKMQIEVLGLTSKQTETQAVILGTHPSGVQYQWNRDLDAGQVPLCTQEQMDYLAEDMLLVSVDRGWKRGKPTRNMGAGDSLSNLGAEPYDRDLVAPVVDLIPNDDLVYDEWVSLGYAIKNALGGDGWPVFEKLSARAPKNNPDYTKRTWDGFNPDGSSGFGKLVHWAREANGGKLPGDLDGRVRSGIRLKQAEQAGMPMLTGEIVESVPADNGRWEYTYSRDGDLIPNMANVATSLMRNNLWAGGFAYDAFNDRTILTRNLPGLPKMGQQLTDGDYTAVHHWFQTTLFHKIGRGDVINAVELAAIQNTYEPVQEYLRNLTWDGTLRINSWLWQYCGVTDTDPVYLTYLTQIGRKWLIGAVARAMNPGCKMDTALIFEGPQGRGKSTALAALCPNPDWFGDHLPDFHTKDASEYLNGKWIVEMAELTQVHKGDLENMRGYLSRRVEDFRAAYDRNNKRRPRRCVFAGSTNRDDYLRDQAGERRFWIVKTDGTFDIPGLTAVRDQLWAEAYMAFQAGEVWYLDDAYEVQARTIQKERVSVDPWAELLSALLGEKKETSVPECMALLGLDAKTQTPAAKKRIEQSLAMLEFKKTKKQIWGAKYRGAMKYARE